MAAWPGFDGFEEVPFPGTADTAWAGPYPDDLLGDVAAGAQGPGARYTPRESISLIFVSALQHLPPRRRAAVVLCDVLGFSAAEAAEILGAGQDAVAAALAEARSVLAAQLPPGWRARPPRPGSAREREVARRFADAFERADADGIAALLTDDAWLASPPLRGAGRGRAGRAGRGRAVAEALSAESARHGPRRFRLVATRANGQPAFGCYLGDPGASVARAHSLLLLTLDGGRVSGVTRFADDGALGCFGLPPTLPC